jgi:hypothetical protein
MTHLLALELAWDPTIRAILVVGFAIVVLPGSIYLLLGTNLGTRLGFLVALAGAMGWMTIMATIWAMYGIGYVGRAASWKVEEAVTSQSKDDTQAAQLPLARDLSTWRELPADDPARGEAQASASAAIAGQAAVLPMGFAADTDYVVVDAWEKGGKKKTFLNGILPGPHPPHYAMIQVQRAKSVTVPFGETPPKAEADPTQPVVSVILERDLGNKRLPPTLLALGSLIIFGVTCNVLHRRDKVVSAARAAAAAS